MYPLSPSWFGSWSFFTARAALHRTLGIPDEFSFQKQMILIFLSIHVGLKSDELESKACVCVLYFYWKYTFVHSIYSNHGLASLTFTYLFLCQGTCMPWYSHPRHRTTLCDGFAFHLIWGKLSLLFGTWPLTPGEQAGKPLWDFTISTSHVL